MATRAYTITSHYTPPVSDDGTAGEDSEGNDLEQEKIWQTGPLYKSRFADSDIYVSHRAAHPPRFVPAVFSRDNLTVPRRFFTISQPERPSVTSKAEGVGSWYQSLRSTVGSEVRDAQPDPAPVALSGPSASTTSIHLSASTATQPASKKRRKSRPQDWFIHNALATSALTSHHSPFAVESAASSSSSLADILSRAPPPLPGSNDSKFIPPLRTKLGPGNRGYALLAQQGWREGEGLGSWRKRPIAQPFTGSMTGGSGTAGGWRSVERDGFRSRDAVEYPLKVGEESGGATASDKTPQIVDLTTADDDSTSESGEEFLSSLLPPAGDIDEVHKSLDPSRTVLLVPLKTYLKSDRLGIGAHRRRLLSSSLRNTQRQEQISSTTPTPRSSFEKRKPLTDTAQAMYDARDRERRRREQEHRALMFRLKGSKQGSKGFRRQARRKDETEGSFDNSLVDDP